MSDNTSELRFNCDVELRAIDGDKARLPKIVGYAAIFNSVTNNIPGFSEVILPGAFRDALASKDEVLALFEHDPKQILGRRSRGTLTLEEDGKGLRVEIDTPNTTLGRDAVEGVRRGDLAGMSFRFKQPVDSWRRDGGTNLRSISKFGKLLEVTLTGLPVYESTTAEVRSALEALNAPAYDRTDYLKNRLKLAELSL